jgi:chemotaxis methyl-accepting protein methylase
MANSVDYQHYSAKLPGSGSGRSFFGRAARFAKHRLFYDFLMLPYALHRHRRLLRESDRTSEHTYTCFLRAPSQLELLAGPIMAHLMAASGRGRLDITLLACSNGAEAYTITSWLRERFPDLEFHIQASDLHQSMADRAAAGAYSADEALHSEYMTRGFQERTFDVSGGVYTVKPEIRQHVTFSQANLLDGEALQARFGQAPLVIAQNVLFHLKPEDAARAFGHVMNLTAPGGVMMVEGMDQDLRVRLTRQHGLKPFTQNLRAIYNETRVHTPPNWWQVYWGSEPYLPFRQQREHRYATAFMKDGGGA